MIDVATTWDDMKARPRQKSRSVERVLVLSHMFPHPDQPGSGPFVHEQVAALRNYADIDARVVSCRPYWMNSKDPRKLLSAARVYRETFRRFRWERYQGVPVLYPPYLVGGVLGFWSHAFTYSLAVRQWAEKLWRDFPFDIVHAHTGYLDGFAGWMLARQFHVPLVITEHTGPFSYLTDKAVVRDVTLFALNHAQRVWCVSEALARDVRQHLPNAQHISTLPNGVDLEQFTLPRAAIKSDPQRPKLLMVCSLDDYKNPFLLMRALPRVLQRVPGASLGIVGDGPLRSALQQHVAAQPWRDAVRFYGQQPRARVARLMREACDILVHTSRGETFGVVFIEAMACGKPVVCTRTGGAEDIVREPWLGTLCPQDDDDALADALINTIECLPQYDAARLRAHAANHYDYRYLAHELRRNYQELRG